MVLLVEDNAGLFGESDGRTDGLGMSIVDKRIKNLYGEAFGISVDFRDGEWTRVSIKLPQPEMAT